ncbi:glycoside hydrolase family 88 protein [bacterium]|nr:glycoside hydrolase family 88 protein [bacterium]
MSKPCLRTRSWFFIAAACLFVQPLLFAQLDWGQQMVESCMTRTTPAQMGSWAYAKGFYFYGQYRIWQLTGETGYFQYIRDWVDLHVDDQGNIATGFGNLDNCQPGLVTLLCYVETREEKYKLAADHIRNVFYTYPRTSDGGFWHGLAWENELWADGAFMILPFLVNYAAVFGDTSLYTEAANQIITYASHLQDASGLLYHAYDEDGSADWADPVTHHSPLFWGRAMGWFGMAIVEILDLMPAGHPERPQLIQILADLIEGLAAEQDAATGLWYQIVDGDQPDNWLESSCSCMVTFFIARAVQKGYVDSGYGETAVKGYEGIIRDKTTVGSDNLVNLLDTCAGTSASADYSYYISRGRVTNDNRGLGAFLLMCWQMAQSDLIDGTNSPPAVQITSPADSSYFMPDTDIVIEADCHDPDGQVIMAEFHEGNNRLSTDSEQPWSISWDQVPEGEYIITARAGDDGNAVTISSPVHVFVTDSFFRYEAENGTLSTGSVDSNYPDFTGTGFVNFDNMTGSWLELTLPVPKSGPWEIRFRYANGAANNRPCEIRVNGSVVESSLDFPVTGTWDNWQYSDALTVNLEQGDQTIRITGNTAESGPNIDHVQGIFRSVDVSTYSLLDIMETLFAERLQTGDPLLRRACIERIDDLIYDTYPPINPHAERAYRTMVFKAIMEIKHTAVTQGAVVWHIQNHGFVVKTSSLTLGFDLYDYYNYQEFSILADLIDVYFISHEHRDHFSALLIDAMHALGKPVVGPAELPNSPNFQNVSIHMNAGDNLTIAGCTVTAYDGGDHAVPVRLYEVVTPDGLKLMHTGDKEYTTGLPAVSGIDILMFDAWISVPAGERTDETRSEGIRTIVNLYQPEVAIAGHTMELGHLQYISPAQPAWLLYQNAYAADDGSILSEYRIPAWGERYQYDAPVDGILPNAVENLTCQIQQNTVVVSWDPPQAASDGETATFYRVIVNDTYDYWIDETEFHHPEDSDLNFKVYAYDRCGNQSGQYREITGQSNSSTFTLDVPRTAAPPAIDGIMDPVWYSVCTTPMEKPNPNSDVSPDNWLDCTACFKMMVDCDNCYLFIQAHDDEINTSNALSYYNDSFELFFDGDNSKNDQTVGYDANDVRLRYVYGQTSEDIGNAPNSECAFLNTAYGYNLEIRIPQTDMTFDLNPDHTFGFDIAMNDNDGGDREHVLTWWSESLFFWADPSHFGTARTTGYVAADPMIVLNAAEAPVIDGSDEDVIWENSPWISSNRFVDRSGGIMYDPPLDLADVNGYNDCRFNYKMMWRNDMLYFYANVFDDAINTSQTNYYLNDCFQINLDGNNDKSTSNDANDCEYDFVFTETPSEDAAFTVTDFGWTIEARMDLGAKPGISLSDGQLMGLEVHLNDNDTGTRDLSCQWWSNDNSSWADPGKLGTVRLTGITTDVDESHKKSIPRTWHLAQNFPNPFNPVTQINYQLPKSSFVCLSIYNVSGQLVDRLVNENKDAGFHSVIWNAADAGSGLYFYHISAGKYSEVKKCLVLK